MYGRRAARLLLLVLALLLLLLRLPWSSVSEVRRSALPSQFVTASATAPAAPPLDKQISGRIAQPPPPQQRWQHTSLPGPRTPAASSATKAPAPTAQPRLIPLRAYAPCPSASAADARAPLDCLCGLRRGQLLLIRSEKNGRYLTSFPNGGEVFAIGSLDRMPLRRLAFRLTAASSSAASSSAASAAANATTPWLELRHVSSGGVVHMVPADAAEGAYMLLIGPSVSAIPSHESRHFCLQPTVQGRGRKGRGRKGRGHKGGDEISEIGDGDEDTGGGFLFSRAVGGTVSQRGRGVLIRGLGDGFLPIPKKAPRRRAGYSGLFRTSAQARPQRAPGGHGDESRLSFWQTSEAELELDDARWRDRLLHPSRVGGGRGGGGEGARGGAPSAAPSASAGGASAAPLHVFTYATKVTPGLCASLELSLAMGVSLTVIGLGETYEGNFQKLESARSHVGALPADTLVLFADA